MKETIYTKLSKDHEENLETIFSYFREKNNSERMDFDYRNVVLITCLDEEHFGIKEKLRQSNAYSKIKSSQNEMKEDDTPLVEYDYEYTAFVLPSMNKLLFSKSPINDEYYFWNKILLNIVWINHISELMNIYYFMDFMSLPLYVHPNFSATYEQIMNLIYSSTGKEKALVKNFYYGWRDYFEHYKVFWGKRSLMNKNLAKSYLYHRIVKDYIAGINSPFDFYKNNSIPDNIVEDYVQARTLIDEEPDELCILNLKEFYKEWGDVDTFIKNIFISFDESSIDHQIMHDIDGLIASYYIYEVTSSPALFKHPYTKY